MSLIPHEGAQLVNLSGMMLPTIRNTDGGITVQIVPTDLVIRPDPEGSLLEVREFGSDDTLERVEPSEGEALDEWVGDYNIGSREGSAVLSRSGDGYQLTLVNGLGSLTYPLVPLGPRLWQMVSPVPMPLGGTLEFEEGAFLFSTASTTRLRFHRS
jgi:hypothetical protein